MNLMLLTNENLEGEKSLTDSNEFESNEATGGEELEREEGQNRTNEPPEPYDQLLSNANVRPSEKI